MPPAIDEHQVFTATPRRREKPTVPLSNVTILSRNQPATPVDLFDALYKYHPSSNLILISIEDLSQRQERTAILRKAD